MSQSLELTDESGGRYERQHARLIGQGGLGRIIGAYDRHLEREVAIKELLDYQPAIEGPDDPMTLRFVREARVTAMLDHPSIVPIYELGRRGDGSLYYVMRLVHGQTLLDVLQQAGTMEGRLGLLGHFVDLCNAIAYANSLGVVHRDIKPGNVMVGKFGETIVLDWGTARVLNARSGEVAPSPLDASAKSSDATAKGALIGTPIYMSPEQAGGRNDQIDDASDTWSLGIVLYQMITGELPYREKEVAQVLLRAAAGEVIPARERCPDAPPELLAIVDRCLRKDKAERYPSAKALANDVEAYRTGGAVSVYSYSRREMIARFLKRHRIASLTALVFTIALFAVATGAYFRVVDERDRAVSAERDSRLHLAEVMLGQARSAGDKGRWVEAEADATAALLLSDLKEARGFLAASSDRWRPHLLRRRAVADCPVFAIDAAGGWAACAGDGRVRVEDARNGRIAARADNVDALQPSSLAVAGERVLLLDRAGSLWAWDWSGSPSPRVLIRGKSPIVAFGAEPASGSLLAFGDAAGSISWGRLGPDGFESLQTREGISPSSAFAFSADGRRLASGDSAGWIQVWDLDGRKIGAPIDAHQAEVALLRFSPRGDRLASAGKDLATRVWDIERGKLVAQHGEQARALAFARDGSALMFVDESGVFRLQSLATRAITFELLATRRQLVFGALDSNTDRFFALDAARELREWSLAAHRALTARIPLGSAGRAADFSSASSVVALSAKETILLRNISSGRTVDLIGPMASPIGALRHSADGTLLAYGLEDGTIHLFEPETKKDLEAPAGSKGAVVAIAVSAASAVSAHGRLLAAADESGTLLAARVLPGQPPRSVSVEGFSTAVVALTFEGAEETLWAGGKDGRIGILEARGDQLQLRNLVAGPAPLVSIASEPRARHVVAVFADGTVMLIERGSNLGRKLARSAVAGARSLAIWPDGQWAAIGTDAGQIRVLDLANDRTLAVIEAHKGAVEGLTVAPEGDVIVSTSKDGSAASWDARDLATPPATLADRVARRYGIDPREHLSTDAARRSR